MANKNPESDEAGQNAASAEAADEGVVGAASAEAADEGVVDAASASAEAGSADEGVVDAGSAEASGKKKKLLFLIIGIAVLILGIAAGVLLWVFTNEDAISSDIRPKVSKVLVVNVPLPSRNSEKKKQETKKRVKKQSNRRSSEKKLNQSSPVLTKVPKISKVPKTSVSKALQALGVGGLGRAGSPGEGLVVPSVTIISYQKIPNLKKAEPLSKAPDRKLEMKVPGLKGAVPIIGKDDREPRTVYSRPSMSSIKGPRAAIVVSGLGFSRTATQSAIKKLPGEVSLAFSPYAKRLNDWLMRARLSGHEVFLELPMESKKFPLEDPGPLALNTSLQLADNMKQLYRVMSKMGGYVGLISTMGSKFNEAEGQLKPILAEIKKHGLMFVDGGRGGSVRKIAVELKIPKAFVNLTLDTPPDGKSFRQKLRSLENRLKKSPGIVASIHAYPKSIERINTWIKTLKEKKISLIPLSAMSDVQPIE